MCPKSDLVTLSKKKIKYLNIANIWVTEISYFNNIFKTLFCWDILAEKLNPITVGLLEANMCLFCT
jgi:hypothetical protein